MINKVDFEYWCENYTYIYIDLVLSIEVNWMISQALCLIQMLSVRITLKVGVKE